MLQHAQIKSVKDLKGKKDVVVVGAVAVVVCCL